MRVDRFVLDCNIWVSYFITKSEQKLIDIISLNDLAVFSCQELLTEIERVLSYKHLRKYKPDVGYALKLVKLLTVTHVLNRPIKRYIPTDADDDYIIALALQTNAGFVTSGDGDILDAKETLERKFRKLRILTKAEFEGRFRVQ